MEREHDGNAGTVLLAFVLGAVTGAAVALLLAPVPGEEARRYLKERAQEGRDKAEDAGRQGREYLNRQRESFSAAVERGKEAYKKARSGESEEDA